MNDDVKLLSMPRGIIFGQNWPITLVDENQIQISASPVVKVGLMTQSDHFEGIPPKESMMVVLYDVVFTDDPVYCDKKWLSGNFASGI